MITDKSPRMLGASFEKFATMKILYDQTQLKRSLILGIAYLVIGMASLVFKLSPYLAGFGGLGVLYGVNYFAHRNKAYVTLHADTISEGYIFKTEIEVKDIKSIKYFAGDYTIKTSDKKMVIDTNLIDKSSLDVMKSYFDQHINSI